MSGVDPKIARVVRVERREAHQWLRNHVAGVREAMGLPPVKPVPVDFTDALQLAGQSLDRFAMALSTVLAEKPSLVTKS